MSSPTSPLTGQLQPPEGYQLDVTPPPGYQLDSASAQTPASAAPPVEQEKPTTQEPPPIHPVLQQVLDENPGLSKNFNADNTSLVFADPERSKRGVKERGGLEYWPADEQGDKDYPHPSPGKNVLEIYSDDLKNNPDKLKQAVYGDLMHGMSSDPYWKGLRDKFMQTFTPQEIKRQEQHKTWWEDVNGDKGVKGNPTYDAYIRGWIADEGEGESKGQAESGHTMYSPEQIRILRRMEVYLKTGKVPSDDAKKPPAPKPKPKEISPKQ